MISCTYYNDVLGRIRIKEDGGYIVAIEFANGDESVEMPEEGKEVNYKLLDSTYLEIEEYISGKRQEFTFPYKLDGTDFQVSVWKELLNIPYGEVATYKDIAQRIGNPKAVRAVGSANNKNKLPIVVPCHRVIGSNGKLVGYAAGLDIKEKLLTIEREGMFKPGEVIE